MSYSLSAACCWIVLASMLAAIPSNDNHWRRAYFLMMTGGPILIWVYWTDGLWMGLLVTAAAMSVFRWPMRYACAWVWRLMPRGRE